MAAAARPLPPPDDSMSPGVTRLGRARASPTEIDYRKLHRGTLAREKIPSQGADKSSDVQESRLETILKAIAGVHDSVDERLALVQDAIEQVPDIEQVKEAVSEEAAAKDYHDAIRKQQRLHWHEFLAEDTNIWKASRYLKPDDGSGWSRIPPLQKADGSTTTNNSRQAEQLLATFFPPLPENIEDEGDRPQRQPVPMPELTVDEIECCLMKTKPWKGAGEDGLPAGVWRQVWPAVSESVRQLFQTSLDTGAQPRQWKIAKIIPLKKPNKGDYTLAKAWRPISLLSTAGKLLEAVVVERISYAVETYGLLPANHFGARKQRSAEQALLLLQERIYSAWRSKKVGLYGESDMRGRRKYHRWANTSQQMMPHCSRSAWLRETSSRHSQGQTTASPRS
jgi:hypothetical protein